MATARYRVESLRKFALSLFTAAGMDVDKAGAVAEVLVVGDLDDGAIAAIETAQYGHTPE